MKSNQNDPATSGGFFARHRKPLLLLGAVVAAVTTGDWSSVLTVASAFVNATPLGGG